MRRQEEDFTGPRGVSKPPNRFHFNPPSLADDPAACAHTELIETIRTWAKAYPLAVFPEPPPGEHGATVDACSARVARHVLGRLVELINGAAETGERTNQQGEQ